MTTSKSCMKICILTTTLLFLCYSQSKIVNAGGSSSQKVQKKPTTQRVHSKAKERGDKTRKNNENGFNYWTPRELSGISPQHRYVVLINSDTKNNQDSSVQHKQNVRVAQKAFHAMGFLYENQCIVGANPQHVGTLLYHKATLSNIYKCLGHFVNSAQMHKQPSVVVIYTTGHGRAFKGDRAEVYLDGSSHLSNRHLARYVSEVIAGKNIRLGYIGDQCFSGRFPSALAQVYGFDGFAFGLNACAKAICAGFTPQFFQRLIQRLKEKGQPGYKIQSISEAFTASFLEYKRFLKRVYFKNGKVIVLSQGENKKIPGARQIIAQPSVYYGIPELNDKGYKKNIDTLWMRSFNRPQIIQFSLPTCIPCIRLKERIDTYLIRTKGFFKYNFLTLDYDNKNQVRNLFRYLKHKISGFNSKNIKGYPDLYVIRKGKAQHIGHYWKNVVQYLSRNKIGLDYDLENTPIRYWVMPEWCRAMKKKLGGYPNVCKSYVTDFPKAKVVQRKKIPTTKQVKSHNQRIKDRWTQQQLRMEQERNKRYVEFKKIWRSARELQGTPLLSQKEFDLFPKRMVPAQIALAYAKNISHGYLRVMIRDLGGIKNAMTAIRCGLYINSLYKKYKNTRPNWTVEKYCSLHRWGIDPDKLKKYSTSLSHETIIRAVRYGFTPNDVQRLQQNKIPPQYWFHLKGKFDKLDVYAQYIQKHRMIGLYRSYDFTILHRAVYAGFPVNDFIGYPSNMPFAKRYHYYVMSYRMLTGQVFRKYPILGKTSVWLMNHLTVERQIGMSIIFLLLLIILILFFKRRKWKKKYLKHLEKKSLLFDEFLETHLENSSTQHNSVKVINNFPSEQKS